MPSALRSQRVQVTLIPRGQAKGLTWFIPGELVGPGGWAGQPERSRMWHQHGAAAVVRAGSCLPTLRRPTAAVAPPSPRPRHAPLAHAGTSPPLARRRGPVPDQ